MYVRCLAQGQAHSRTYVYVSNIKPWLEKDLARQMHWNGGKLKRGTNEDATA